jgi:hypothetical protein
VYVEREKEREEERDRERERSRERKGGEEERFSFLEIYSNNCLDQKFAFNVISLASHLKNSSKHII